MLHTHHHRSQAQSAIEDLYPDHIVPTLDKELVPSLGIALAGVLGAYVVVWLLTLPFARL
jgi:hypothetical protein